MSNIGFYFKQSLFLLLIYYGLVAPVYAGGKRDVTERSVDHMESWQESFDINEKKPGKYNILVTATDKGGNTQIEGPFNLYIDPESDLPVAGITNPLTNMRVPGNLNIVGTCVDDDGVKEVYLILDNDVENPVKAQGSEFWSYYLDTNELDEGSHTIEVYGVDVNGLQGHSYKLTWNLDRRQPVTYVTSYGLGELVSGKINLKGTVYDGNGIKSLAYSLDNGNSFIDIKVSENKKEGVCEFDLPINTTLAPDGPAVCWFKAIDKMGSVGLYSYLYFIDNTPPNVVIVSPEEGEAVNGKLGVAGFAKDTIGLKKLSWTFNGQSGDIDLIPGNPYWCVEIDTTGITSKSIPFTITATDTVNNVVTVTRNMPLNQEADKPVVSVQYPSQNGFVDGYKGSLFIRGIVRDDDGVASVKCVLDGKEEKTLDVKGVFYTPLSVENDLAPGMHTITVTAEDMYGVKSNPVTINFIAKGNVPEIDYAKIRSSEGTLDAYPGVVVHPETNPVFETVVSSDSLIKEIKYQISWGKENVIEQEVPVKTPVKSQSVSIPLTGPSHPWGLIKLSIFATDIYDRTSEQKVVINIQDLTNIVPDVPYVVFDSSDIAEDGSVVTNSDIPLTGYFLGGNAKSVDVVPSTSLVKATVDSNVITIVPTSEIGKSEEVKIVVTTDQNIKYESRPLRFVNLDTAPELKFNVESGHVFSGYGDLKLTGSVKSKEPVKQLKYRVITAETQSTTGVVTGVSPFVANDFVELDASSKDFVIDITADNFAAGFHIVEVVADNGKTVSDAVFVRKISELPVSDDPKKPVIAAKPFIQWFEGEQLYWTAVFQGVLDKNSEIVSKETLNAGTNTILASVKDDKDRVTSSKYTFSKQPTVKLSLDSVVCNGETRPYTNGMKVSVPYGQKSSTVMNAKIISDTPLTAVSYTITGEKTVGGAESVTGKAVVKNVGNNEYIAEIPLSNLPVRITKITVRAEAAKIVSEYEGSFLVVRERDNNLINNTRQIYWIPHHSIRYDEKSDVYVIEPQAQFGGFVNAPLPESISLVNPVDGLNAVIEDNYIYVMAYKEGLYKNVSVKVKDNQGGLYTSKPVNLLVDANRPFISINTPEVNKWVKNSVDLSVTATDTNGITFVEYSIDNGQTWSLLRKNDGNSYSGTVTLDGIEDGLVSVDVRAQDGAGKNSMASTVIQKDTTPPQVKIVIPAESDIVNGENRIAFIVKDEGRFYKAEYVAPSKAKVAESIVPLDMEPMINTMIGTAEKPIDDLMQFRFYDECGNSTAIRTFDFIIDAKSDLPIAEIQLPEENVVVTRDFSISGVIYDDDGPCKLWWKIDDDKYQVIEDYSNSFSIDVPLLSLTDNEHKITVYAEDLHGLKGPEVVRNFRVSLEEPKGEVVSPEISTTVKGSIKMTGKASDKNGIKAVYVSIDNGNTYDEALGVFGHDQIDTSWNYTFDTRVVKDGTHVVFLKIVDWYGIEGLFSSLINIDNTNPTISLELPLDGSTSSGMVFFSGQTTDNIGLEKLYLTVRSLDGKNVSSDLREKSLTPAEIISQGFDLNSLEDGMYNVSLAGYDAADNVTLVSRNIILNKKKPVAKVDQLYPLNGEYVHGVFNIYGTAESEKEITLIQLFIDGKHEMDTNLSESGYYKFDISPDVMPEGQHTLLVKAILEDSSVISSNEQYVNYSPIGPWVTIDNFTYGDFAMERPYLIGRAGYALSEEELIRSRQKSTPDELKKITAAKAVDYVELSLDNGKTFEKVSSGANWRYRIENEDIAEGYHFLLVRATMKNGERAVTRTIVQVDQTKPAIRLISPGQGGRYNQQLEFSGLAHDDVALKSLTLSLRKGDKASYEVPAFIQGLYFDWQFWGATLFNVGAGLTFFDDNVKLQAQWGQFTQSQRDLFSQSTMRYGGDNILGMKILANVMYIPFRYYFGPDWEWLSANIAIGADFTRFNQSTSGKAQTLSALITQLEFPRITFGKQKMFRTIAFYTEGQLWFIPTDVSSDEDIKNIVPQISVGMRLNVF